MKKKKIATDIFIYLALMCLALLYSFFFDSYNLALYGYEPHPFLLVTVILSSYRGLLFAVLGSIFSSILYLTLIHYQIDYETVETIFTWSYFSLPTTIFFLSIFVGLIRQTTHDRYKGFVESDKNREKMLANLDKNQRKIEMENQELKERLVTKEDSIKSLFVISQKMSELDREILIENFFEVLRDHAYVNSAEIYDISNEKIVSSRGFSGIEQSRFNASKENELVVQVINSKKSKSLQDLNINKLNVDENKEMQNVVLAIPLKIDNDLWGVLVIFEIPFLKYVPTTFKMIEIYSQWLSSSLRKVDAFKAMEHHVFFDSEYHAYKNNHFLDRLDEELEQAKSYNIKVSLMKIIISDWQILSIGKRKLTKRLLIESIRKYAKKMDIVALGNNENEVEILVLGSHERAKMLIEKVHSNLKSYKNEYKELEAYCWDYSGEKYNKENYHTFYKKIEVQC